MEIDFSWAKEFVLIKQNKNIAGVNFVITSTKRYLVDPTFRNINRLFVVSFEKW